jgi:cold shock CspA family protein/ribosome-associated translation inhibitor RaiA
MQVPLEISFHNLKSEAWAEDEIRDHVARLEAIFSRLISCRVRVDQRSSNANGTIPPVVRIELGVPGHKDIVVAHEPEHLQRKFQTPDLHNAINEAFRLAERRLGDFKDQMSEHPAGEQTGGAMEFVGQVAEMPPAEDFGFLLTKEGGLLYFHRNSVLVGDFDQLRRGDEVTYVQEAGDTGPTASKVRVRSARH